MLQVALRTAVSCVAKLFTSSRIFILPWLEDWETGWRDCRGLSVADYVSVRLNFYSRGGGGRVVGTWVVFVDYPDIGYRSVSVGSRLSDWKYENCRRRVVVWCVVDGVGDGMSIRSPGFPWLLLRREKRDYL